MRMMNALFLLLMTGAVLGYNSTHANEAILLPGLDLLFPATKGDLAAQSRLTVYGLAALTLLAAGLDVRAYMRSRREEGGES